MNRKQTANDTIELQKEGYSNNSFINFLLRYFGNFKKVLCLNLFRFFSHCVAMMFHSLLSDTSPTTENDLKSSQSCISLAFICYQQLFSFSAVITLSNCLKHLFTFLFTVFLMKAGTYLSLVPLQCLAHCKYSVNIY